MLVDCDNTAITIDDEMLYAIANVYGKDISIYPTFQTKCRALHRAIKEEDQKVLKDEYEARPPLSTDLFRRSSCKDLTSQYSMEEWNEFYNQAKGRFPDLADLVRDNMPMQHPWDAPAVCSQMRSSLIRRKQLPVEYLTDVERSYLDAIDRQIAISLEKERQKKIAESIAATNRLIQGGGLRPPFTPATERVSRVSLL